jgi:hypothetical protein
MNIQKRAELRAADARGVSEAEADNCKLLIPNLFHPPISLSASEYVRIRFGTRGSEVQILSPRPIISNDLRFLGSPKTDRLVLHQISTRATAFGAA